jgi:hypothetical protein
MATGRWDTAELRGTLEQALSRSIGEEVHPAETIPTQTGSQGGAGLRLSATQIAVADNAEATILLAMEERKHDR